MPRTRIAKLLFAVAITAPCAGHGEGQTIYRCIGASGEMSFSDAPCDGQSAVRAYSASPRAPVIARDRASAMPTCPASEGALRNFVAEAFARRDANTLASVLRWDGVRGSAARQRMRELADLTGRPLIGIDIDVDGVDENAAGNPPASQATMLTVRTGSLEGGASEREFRLMPARGCYWLDW
jgi:hypothetical protein